MEEGKKELALAQLEQRINFFKEIVDLDRRKFLVLLGRANARWRMKEDREVKKYIMLDVEYGNICYDCFVIDEVYDDIGYLFFGRVGIYPIMVPIEDEERRTLVKRVAKRLWLKGMKPVKIDREKMKKRLANRIAEFKAVLAADEEGRKIKINYITYDDFYHFMEMNSSGILTEDVRHKGLRLDMSCRHSDARAEYFLFHNDDKMDIEYVLRNIKTKKVIKLNKYNDSYVVMQKVKNRLLADRKVNYAKDRGKCWVYGEPSAEDSARFCLSVFVKEIETALQQEKAGNKEIKIYGKIYKDLTDWVKRRTSINSDAQFNTMVLKIFYEDGVDMPGYFLFYNGNKIKYEFETASIELKEGSREYEILAEIVNRRKKDSDNMV